MRADEYQACDAVELATLVREREVTPDELADCARAIIHTVNPSLNALAGPLFDVPQSYDPNGVFAGVPCLIKDIGILAAGVPTQLGTQHSGAGFVPPTDSALMGRVRRAGLHALGRTTTPEFGLSTLTESRLYGVTRNPWALDRSPGGSSGGSAALVAAGAVPIAHGNDLGGSIRVPAAWTGLVGLKPTRGRITNGPAAGTPTSVAQFGLTRTVRDTAALLDALAGQEPDEWWTLPVPDEGFFAAAGRAPERLRIAVAPQWWRDDIVADPEQVRAVRDIADALARLGHEVVEDRPPYDWRAADDAFLTQIMLAQAGLYRELEALTGTTPNDETWQAVSLAFARAGLALTADEINAANGTIARASSAIQSWFDDVDILLTPTTAHGPSELGAINQDDADCTPEQWIRLMWGDSPFCSHFNWAGNPAISLPLATTDRGLPLGIQLVGRYGDEALLLQLSTVLEAERPWRGRRPALATHGGGA